MPLYSTHAGINLLVENDDIWAVHVRKCTGLPSSLTTNDQASVHQSCCIHQGLQREGEAWVRG